MCSNLKHTTWKGTLYCEMMKLEILVCWIHLSNWNFVERWFDLYDVILEQVEWLQADETVYIQEFAMNYIVGGLAKANIFRCCSNHYKNEERISVLEIFQNLSIKNFFYIHLFSFFNSPFLLVFLKLFIIIDWRNILIVLFLCSPPSLSVSLSPLFLSVSFSPFNYWNLESLVNLH